MLTGGIAGATGQRIINCKNNGAISGISEIGGIVGYYQEEGGIAPFELIGCLNNGSVSAGDGWAGGITGLTEVSSETSLIARCYNTAEISASSLLGGIAGETTNANIENCYNTGKISGNNNANYAGGISGYFETTSSVSNCYNAGDIVNTKADKTGGIIGMNKEMAQNCFYLENTAEPETGGSVMITNEELADQTTFTDAGWDFEAVWTMSAELGRPVLQSVPEEYVPGAEQTPYLIHNEQELKEFRDNVNSGNTGIYARLVADIVLNDGIDMAELAADADGNVTYEGGAVPAEFTQWEPIGNSANAYIGTFDGNGYTISGLYINSPSENYKGLFGNIKTGVLISNLNVSGAVRGNMFVGGVSGCNYGSIINCHSSCVISGSTMIGGITGIGTGSIEECSNNGNIYSYSSNTDKMVGGIIGSNSTGARLINCVNNGSVKSENGEYNYIGGIAGINHNELKGCLKRGSVEANGSFDAIGGIVGSNIFSVSDCVNEGSITAISLDGAQYMTMGGGIVGSNTYIVSGCSSSGKIMGIGSKASAGGVAGLLAWDSYSPDFPYLIENCYNTGEVTSDRYAGGLVGYLNAGSVKNSYTNGRVQGTIELDGVKADGIIGYYNSYTPDRAPAENCYFISDESLGYETIEGVDPKTTEEFASGEVAYLLQASQTDGGSGAIPQVWGQGLKGGMADASPLLTDAESKTAYKVSFMVGGSVYDVKYANPSGTASLPKEPQNDAYSFIRWSQTESIDGAEFTLNTPVSADISVYAVCQEMYGGSDGEKTVTAAYREGAVQDLSEFMEYAAQTEVSGRFTYTITGGNKDTETENGNTVAAEISGDMLMIPADTNADTYILKITAAEKDPVISLMEVDHGTEPVELEITIIIKRAETAVTLTTENAQGVGENRSIDLTAQVSGAADSGQPGGTVEFYNGEEKIGSAELTEGKAVYTWSNVPVGTHSLKAVYAGDDCYSGSEGTTEYDLDKDTQQVLVIEPVSEKTYGDAPFMLNMSGGSGSGGGGGVASYTVKFDTQGGSEISSLSVTSGNTIEKPSDPEREGYTFAGWYTDKECTAEFDFETKTTKSITLYAKWTEAVEPEQTAEPEITPEPSQEWENPFTDVSESDWFYESVKYAAETGLFSGMTDTTFEPDTAITRAMLVTVLWRSEGEPVVNYAMMFSDVDQGAYYGEAVRWAASEGIVKGYDESTFAPDDLITREQIAAILERFAGYKGMTTDETADIGEFADASTVSEWAYENVQWAVGAGIISGRTDGTFDPLGSATRAETAAMLQRLFEG